MLAYFSLLTGSQVAQAESEAPPTPALDPRMAWNSWSCHFQPPSALQMGTTNPSLYPAEAGSQNCVPVRQAVYQMS